MEEELEIVVRKQAKGRRATPWLDVHRERFSKAAREAGEELKGTKLRGAARVLEFNQRVAEKLRSPGPESP